MKLYNEKDELLDFYRELTKYAGYLRKSYLTRHLALYELFKNVIQLPGSVAEFGMYDGSTFFFLARLIETFNNSEHEVYASSSHHLFGFDNFEGFREIKNEDESNCSLKIKKRGGLKGNRESFFDVLEKFKSECSISQRLHIIEGNIEDTWKTFLQEWKWARFSFCLIDFDLFEPTKIVLDKLYDLMVPGGIIVFDEYGFREFPGETKAVDEFIRMHKLCLKSIPWTFAPAAYCVIPSGK